jgi:hypothetical protein
MPTLTIKVVIPDDHNDDTIESHVELSGGEIPNIIAAQAFGFAVSAIRKSIRALCAHLLSNGDVVKSVLVAEMFRRTSNECTNDGKGELEIGTHDLPLQRRKKGKGD